MWPFSKKEKRQAETVPHKVIDTNACTEVNDGVALLNKLLNIKGYDAMSQSHFKWCRTDVMGDKDKR